ncbi:MAG: hypothetical protein M0Z50_13200 [Planctomycetia bacterium]|jgi:hypothetical protein|nr:hypothetical protein [Planctomycetia bacterium]
MAGEYLALYVKHPSDIDFCWGVDDEVLLKTLKKVGFNEDEINNYISLKTEYIDLLEEELRTLWSLVNDEIVKIVPSTEGFIKVRSKDAYIYKMRRMETKIHKMSLYFQVLAIDNDVRCQFGIWSRGGKAAAHEMLKILDNKSWSVLPDWYSGYVVHNDIIIKNFMNNEQKSVNLQDLVGKIIEPFSKITKNQWKKIVEIANPRQK